MVDETTEAELVWKLVNPKDESRDDVSMYNGREVSYKSDNLGPGHYVILTECVGKGITALRQVLMNLKVWEKGAIVLRTRGTVSPRANKMKHTFVINETGKIELFYTGSASYAIKNVHMRAAVYKFTTPQSSTTLFPSYCTDNGDNSPCSSADSLEPFTPATPTHESSPLATPTSTPTSTPTTTTQDEYSFSTTPPSPTPSPIRTNFSPPPLLKHNRSSPAMQRNTPSTWAAAPAPSTSPRSTSPTSASRIPRSSSPTPSAPKSPLLRSISSRSPSPKKGTLTRTTSNRAPSPKKLVRSVSQAQNAPNSPSSPRGASPSRSRLPGKFSPMSRSNRNLSPKRERSNNNLLKNSGASFTSPTSASLHLSNTSLPKAGQGPNLPAYCWSRQLSKGFPEHKEFSVTPYEAMRLAGLGYRMKKYIDYETDRGRLPVMNPFKKSPAGPRMGVPLGGIGAGTIGRGWRGDFGRWSILPGFPNYKTLDANNFSVKIQRKNKPSPEATVLQPTKPHSKRLGKAWNFGISGKKSTNYSLYPQSWTEYNEPCETVKLTCRQVSPFIPHNYKETSFPCGVFEWYIQNMDDEEVDVSLMFTFQNGIGESFDKQGGHKNSGFKGSTTSGSDVLGVNLKYNLPSHRTVRKDVVDKAKKNEQQLNARFSEIDPSVPFTPDREVSTFFEEFCKESSQNDEMVDPMSFAIAVSSEEQNVHLTSQDTFSIKGGGDRVVVAKELWQQFADKGGLAGSQCYGVSAVGETIGGAVCGSVTVPPGECKKIVFSLAWDVPICRFNSGTGYFRRYTNYFGRDGENASKIAIHALSTYKSWISDIEKWQTPILEDKNLPNWYKQALFNELYYLVEGGSIWVGDRVSSESDVLKSQMAFVPEIPEKETYKTVGKFGYLESLEYIMVNTYDVHFYASWALAMLFPLLDMSLQVDFCQATLIVHPIEWKTLHSGDRAIRKVKGAVPHDLGNPGDDPWTWVNSYCIQEINSWKDLNSKLVLQVFRDYHLSKNVEFLRECWPVVQIAVEYISKFDKDGDGLIENEGFPDQTYDTWSATGASSYCGGLWVCALAACTKIAEVLGEDAKSKSYQERWQRAKTAFHEKLWNGEYYCYDTSNSDHYDSIQADSMCGQWWARACGLPSISEDACVRSSLQKIFDFNVKKFKCGQIGPINGMRPDGKPDTSCMQSVEVWTGTTFGLAATMMQEGMIEEAFSTAKGIVRVTYDTVGYMFQTPEAWDSNMNYRALSYMRPLAIWGIQYAWQEGGRQLRPNPDLDLLETELGDAIRKQEKGYLQSLAHRHDKVSNSTITIVYVGGETSGIRDLFLACWNRTPVDDVMREKCDGVMSATGKEPLEKGKNVEYDMLLVEDKEGVEKMREICSKGVIIVCAYSVYCPASRKWIQEKFIPEAGTHFPNVPVMVVGTGTEARELVLPGVTSFTPDEGKKFSMELQEKCPSVRAHVECSPVTFQGFRTLANMGLSICLIGKVKQAKSPRPSPKQQQAPNQQESCCLM